MGTTRKAPTGAKHARCVAHEAYPTAPAGWLCFADSAPTDETILERFDWADDLEASRLAHRAAWAAFQAETAPSGVSGHVPRPYDVGIYAPTATARRPMTAEERAESERAAGATAAQWRAAIVRNPKTYGMTRQQAERMAEYGEAEAA